MNCYDIVFLQTAHAADDDRVWYHQFRSLSESGFSVKIISNKRNFSDNPHFHIVDTSNLNLRQRIKNYAEALSETSPRIIICDTPVAIKSASLYKKRHKNCKVVYDVTEWYPSKKNLRGLSILKKTFKFCAMVCANLSNSSKTDGFIFGETDKAKPYRRFFPRKPFIMLPYYPDLGLITPLPATAISNGIRLFYAGSLTDEKGFQNVMKVAETLAGKNHKRRVFLSVITDSKEITKNANLDNLNISIIPWQTLEDFCKIASDNDIFLDLRKIDKENDRCMPIKIFYYMAMRRPVIYSALSAIEKGCPEISSFGHLVQPTEHEVIAEIIEKYINDSGLYQRHSNAARELAEQKYNWSSVEPVFINFIKQLWASN